MSSNTNTPDMTHMVLFHHKEDVDTLPPSFLARYEVPDKKLTNFLDVWQCRHKETGELRSVKIVRKNKGSSNLEELKILKELDHPGVQRIYESFENNQDFYVVTESLDHPNALEYIKPCLTELERGQKVAILMVSLLGTLQYCHDHESALVGERLQVVHGKIRPQNILVMNEKECRTRLVNFESAILSNPMFGQTKGEGMYLSDSSSEEEQNVAKPSIDNHNRLSKYDAPELAQTGPTPATDLWECGVLAFWLLSKHHPRFDKQTGCIRNWHNIHDSACRLFLESLLQKDPNDRFPPESQWLLRMLNTSNSATTDTDDAVAQHLAQLGRHHQLQVAVRSYIVTHLLHQRERDDLEGSFRDADANQDGIVSRDELKTYLQNHAGFSRNWQAVFDELDQNDDNVISYSEFLAFALEQERLEQHDRVKAAFGALDMSHDGYISLQDLKLFFKTCSAEGVCVITKSTAKAMIQAADHDGDGQLSLEEFTAMMTKDFSKVCESESEDEDDPFQKAGDDATLATEPDSAALSLDDDQPKVRRRHRLKWSKGAKKVVYFARNTAGIVALGVRGACSDIDKVFTGPNVEYDMSDEARREYDDEYGRSHW